MGVSMDVFVVVRGVISFFVFYYVNSIGIFIIKVDFCLVVVFIFNIRNFY